MLEDYHEICFERQKKIWRHLWISLYKFLMGFTPKESRRTLPKFCNGSWYHYLLHSCSTWKMVYLSFALKWLIYACIKIPYMCVQIQRKSKISISTEQMTNQFPIKQTLYWQPRAMWRQWGSQYIRRPVHILLDMLIA